GLVDLAFVFQVVIVGQVTDGFLGVALELVELPVAHRFLLRFRVGFRVGCWLAIARRHGERRPAALRGYPHRALGRPSTSGARGTAPRRARRTIGRPSSSCSTGSYRVTGTSAAVAGVAASVTSRRAVGQRTLVAHPAFSKRRMIPAEESICPRPTPCRA